MTFDPNKTYTIHVWDMPVSVVDDETEDFIRNEDGTVKLFNVIPSLVLLNTHRIHLVNHSPNTDVFVILRHKCFVF